MKTFKKLSSPILHSVCEGGGGLKKIMFGWIVTFLGSSLPLYTALFVFVYRLQNHYIFYFRSLVINWSEREDIYLQWYNKTISMLILAIIHSLQNWSNYDMTVCMWPPYFNTIPHWIEAGIHCSFSSLCMVGMESCSLPVVAKFTLYLSCLVHFLANLNAIIFLLFVKSCKINFSSSVIREIQTEELYSRIDLRQLSHDNQSMEASPCDVVSVALTFEVWSYYCPKQHSLSKELLSYWAKSL